GRLISGGGSDNESIAISSSYPNLSMLVSRQKPPGAAGYLPNKRRFISARPSQSSRRIELNDATDKSRRMREPRVLSSSVSRKSAILIHTGPPVNSGQWRAGVDIPVL